MHPCAGKFIMGSPRLLGIKLSEQPGLSLAASLSMCGLRMLNVPANPGIHSWRLLLLGALALTLGVDLSSEGARDSQFGSRKASKMTTYSSQPRANQYRTKTWAVKRMPATLPW